MATSKSADKQEITWVYDEDKEYVESTSFVRYTLGTKGDNPLICIGVNPSTAKPDKLDQTLKRVANYAKKGHDSWLMLNIYPQRATKPDDMHELGDEKLHRRNVEHIKALMQRLPKDGQSIDIWCAWGSSIKLRLYLSDYLKDIYNEAFKGRNCRFLRRGDLTAQGHPHHPLGLFNKVELEPFDFEEYLKKL